ncbi:MAG: hypothetical protein ACRD68_09860 [Pyrinomonadaceae bacterium]
MMLYQYQIDFGNGYEEASYGGAANQEENPAAWLEGVEAQRAAHRARVLSGERVIEERIFDCVVVQSRPLPGGNTQHVVRCRGGEVTVDEQADGSFSGALRPGYVGDEGLALDRAVEAVRALSKDRR